MKTKTRKRSSKMFKMKMLCWWIKVEVWAKFRIHLRRVKMLSFRRVFQRHKVVSWIRLKGRLIMFLVVVQRCQVKPIKMIFLGLDHKFKEAMIHFCRGHLNRWISDLPNRRTFSSRLLKTRTMSQDRLSRPQITTHKSKIHLINLAQAPFWKTKNNWFRASNVIFSMKCKN